MKKKSATSINSIIIALRPSNQKEFIDTLPNLIKWLSRRKKTVYFYQSDEAKVRKIFPNSNKPLEFLADTEVDKKIDLIITLGGDGTLLGICRKSTKASPPIFGVNMGNLGFITEFTKAEFYDELVKVIHGDFSLIKLPLFKVKILDGLKTISSHYFLNDLVINKNDISRMFTLAVETEEDHIYNLAGDGLIISSPIGSTAYSLAAGGPIIHPQVNSMVLTPICPHALTHRPLVIPDKMKVTIRIPKKADHLALTLDGQEIITIKKSYRIEISKAAAGRNAQLITNQDRSYFKTLKDKFTHGKKTF